MRTWAGAGASTTAKWPVSTLGRGRGRREGSPNGGGCWWNHQQADFSINLNGICYYTLINDHSDGSWGETDIVVKNIVTR